MVWATVSVDLSDIDTDDLRDELDQRSKRHEAEDTADILPIFEAFYRGDERVALSLARQFVQDATGRVLP